MPANEQHTIVPFKELLNRVAGGEENAFTELYLYFGKKLILFGVLSIRFKEIADELAEEVFIRLCANRQG